MAWLLDPVAAELADSAALEPEDVDDSALGAGADPGDEDDDGEEDGAEAEAAESEEAEEDDDDDSVDEPDEAGAELQAASTADAATKGNTILRTNVGRPLLEKRTFIESLHTTRWTCIDVRQMPLTHYGYRLGVIAPCHDTFPDLPFPSR